MKPFRLFAVVLVGTLTSLAGCGGATEDAGHGEPASDHHGSGDPGTSAPSEKVALDGALPLADEQKWADAGFACKDSDAANYPDQTIRACIAATNDVAVMVRLAVMDEQVVKWSMLGLPTNFPQDVGAQLDAMADVVFGIVNPADASAVPQLATESTVVIGQWEYERETRHLPDGGDSGYSITASSQALFEQGAGSDLLPAVDTFTLDLAGFVETAKGNGIDCKLEEAMWTDATCDMGQYVVNLTTDPEADDQLRGFWLTTYGSPDLYPSQAAEIVSLFALAGSPELDAVATELQTRWSAPSPSWSWIGGLPTFVLPIGGPWGFSFDGTLVPGLS